MTLEEFVVKIGFQTDKAGIDNIEKNLSNVAKKTNSAFSSVLGLVGKIGLVASAWQVGKFAVQSTAQLERMTAQFEVMLGSAQKANTMVKDIQTLAASTPLTSMGITDAVKTLLSFGVAGDKAINTVRMLGDVAGGDQERLSRLALAYGQTMAATKLRGNEMLQFIEVGFNPLQTMLKNLDKFGLKAGTTMADLQDMVSKGAISAEAVSKAFYLATSEGGMFFHNMQKQSKTLGGLWSTLIDNIQIGLVKAMEPLLPVMKEFVDYLGQIDWTPIIHGAQMVAKALIAIKDNFDLIYPVFVGIFGAAALAKISVWIATLKAGGLSLSAAFASILTPINVAIAGLVGIWMLVNKIKKDTASEMQKTTWAVEESEVLSGSAAFREQLAQKELQAVDPEIAKAKADAARGMYVDGNRLRSLVERRRAAQGILDTYSAAKQRLYGETPDLIPTEFRNASKNYKHQVTNINNNIRIDTKVDDKGQSPLSVAAVKSVADTAIRSALNVRLLGLVEGV